jgi:hypothetical protein
VGKTRLAAAYARARIDEEWRLVAWVNAEDTAAVRGGLVEVAAAIGLDEGTRTVVAAGRAVRRRLEADGGIVACRSSTTLPTRPTCCRSSRRRGQARVLITSNERLVADPGRGGGGGRVH